MSAKVFDELTCPECGGAVGGTPAPGMKACTCFQEKPKPRRRPMPDDPDPIDMKPLAPADAGGAPVAAPGQKLCRVCGTDLAGRTRMKDKLGYICKRCSDAEEAAEAAEADADRDAMQCPECKRKLKLAAFVEYRGSLICKRCKADHDDMDVLRVGKVALTKHDEVEKQNVKLYVMIAIGLVLFGLIATWLTH